MAKRRLKILTQEEFRRLSKVCTTKNEARQIIRRMQAVLRDLRQGWCSEHPFLGCPHCVLGFACRTCAYLPPGHKVFPPGLDGEF